MERVFIDIWQYVHYVFESSFSLLSFGGSRNLIFL